MKMDKLTQVMLFLFVIPLLIAVIWLVIKTIRAERGRDYTLEQVEKLFERLEKEQEER